MTERPTYAVLPAVQVVVGIVQLTSAYTT